MIPQPSCHVAIIRIKGATHSMARVKTAEFDFDLVVLGAGIQGAGVAQAAAANGWRVLVIEKQAQAAMGTSSKSSKLIHGGLRYLETFQLKLVRECLKEKALLCKLAPDLVKPARFIIPVYANYKRSPIWIQLGLILYNLLAWPTKTVRGRYPKKAWQEHHLLRQQELQAIFEYEDAQTDDAALTRAVLSSAQKLMTKVRFNCGIKSIDVQVAGGFHINLQNGELIRTRVVVNATGPWVNITAQLVQGVKAPELPIELVQGSHIILRREAPACCYYLESPIDGRAMFVLPWKGFTMVGTTEVTFEGDPEDCRATDAEVKYLLDAYNHFFPSLAAENADIVEKFAGLRVLPNAQTSKNKRSRDTIFLQSNTLPGYLAVYGGKLTAYRKSAEKVIKLIQPFLPQTQNPADTSDFTLRSQ